MAEAKKKDTYYEAVGRRKTSVARVRLYEASSLSFDINDGKDIKKYFPTKELQENVARPFKESGLDKKFKVSAHIVGGGVASQAEALRHGIARALTKFDSELRSPIKKAGLLKRDSRTKERRKFGLKKARKRAQWSKR